MCEREILVSYKKMPINVKEYLKKTDLDFVRFWSLLLQETSPFLEDMSYGFLQCSLVQFMNDRLPRS